VLQTEPATKRFIFRPDVTGLNQTILAPIPAPVVAPAPPGAPGVGRKEEHEPSHETEGHGEQGKHKFVAIQRDDELPVSQAWPLIGGVALLGFMAAGLSFARREDFHPREARRRA
jgi:hypothetical protein